MLNSKDILKYTTVIRFALICFVLGCNSKNSRLEKHGFHEEIVNIFIHPNKRVRDGQIVQIIVPFPKGRVYHSSQLDLLDKSHNPLEAHYSAFLQWHTLDSKHHGIRSIKIKFKITKPVLSSKQLKLGIKPRKSENRVKETYDNKLNIESWKTYSANDFPVSLPMPNIFVTFSKSWLSRLMLRGPQIEISGSSTLFDDAMQGYGLTAVNANSEKPYATEINLADNEPWLFDRSYTLLGLYVRTGKIEWLRHAHRSTMAYLENVEDGYFLLAPNHPDIKYSYGQSLLANFVLTGHVKNLDAISSMATVAKEWNPTYSIDRTFFTERHQAYALSNALAVFEMTGQKEYAERVLHIVSTIVDSTRSQADPTWPSDTCSLHTLGAHEGNDDNTPICSPWMTAILGEVMWRVYWSSQNPKILNYFSDIADWLIQFGLYDSPEHGLSPWYLASSVYQFKQEKEHGWVHSCDVAGLLGRGVLAKMWLGKNHNLAKHKYNELENTCLRSLKEDFVVVDKKASYWKMLFPRKFNWVFGTAGDLPWLSQTISEYKE